MDFLDFIWYLIKIIGSLTILLIICTLFVGVIIDNIRRKKNKDMQDKLDKVILEAIEKGNFDVGVKKIPKKNKK